MSSASLIFWLKFLLSCRSHHITKRLIDTFTGFLFIREQHEQRSRNHPGCFRDLSSCVTPLDQSWDKHSLPGCRFWIRIAVQTRLAMAQQPFYQICPYFQMILGGREKKENNKPPQHYIKIK